VVDDGRVPSERGVSGDRLRRRAGPEKQERDEQKQQNERGEDPAAASHASRLPRRVTSSNRAVRRTREDWLARNRVWFIPYVSALLVVAVEVIAAFTRPLPESAHLVLAAFWGFAVQRGRQRRADMAEQESEIAEFAERNHLPVEYVRDEWTAFKATLHRRRQLPPSAGAHHDDE
jgi:Flp pilus assembly protein TadB